MSVRHYENFPVASVLLPAPLRWPVAVIYRFARTADDLADEGDASSAERLARLDAYRTALDGIVTGRPSNEPLFRDLARVIADHRLPIRLFHDLLDAFAQDVVKQRYGTFAELLDYCRKSANPIGRLLLHLFGAATPPNERRSDAICSALQLTNFWQDLAIDWSKGRVYIPQEDLARFRVSETQIGASDTRGGFAELMLFEIGRARTMLESGAPLATELPGRSGFELRMIVHGGLRVLEKLEVARGDVFRSRPVLRPGDWVMMLFRAARMHRSAPAM